MSIAFIDLAAQQARIKDKLDARIQAVLAHGKYIMGPEVKVLGDDLTCPRTSERYREADGRLVQIKSGSREAVQ